MTLENLVRILPPPTHPYNIGTPNEWATIEEALGFVLPTDYKQFTHTYGTGRIAGFLVVRNPFVASDSDNLLRAADDTLEYLRAAREIDAETVPYPLYREPEGLFPWGTTDQEQTLLWHRVGSPDQWTVVVSDEYTCWQYEQTMTDLLASWLSREQTYEPFPVWYLDPTQFPDEDGNAPPLRIPDRPRTLKDARRLFQPFETLVGDRPGQE